MSIPALKNGETRVGFSETEVTIEAIMPNRQTKIALTRDDEATNTTTLVLKMEKVFPKPVDGHTAVVSPAMTKVSAEYVLTEDDAGKSVCVSTC